MKYEFLSPWTPQLSWALDSLQREKVQLVAQGDECIDLSMVNPDISPPRALLDRLVEASFKPERHRYAIARGIRRLRTAFASKYKQAFGVEVCPETEVCCTTGTKEAVINLLATVLPPRSKVLVGTPTYPVFLAALKLAHHEVLPFELSPDWREMAQTIGARARENGAECILLNFPNNPTGITVPPEFYDLLAQEISSIDCLVINDFVYGEMVKEGASLLSCDALRERAVETYSLSKAYSVPGWRIGAVVGASVIVEAFTKRKQWLDYGTFLPLQDGAAFALESTEDFISPTIAEYHRRAQVVTSCLGVIKDQDVMFTSGLPFIWMRTSHTSQHIGSVALSRVLLSRAGVAVSPGLMFGDAGEGWIRIALVQDEATLIDAASRMAEIISTVRERDYSCDALHAG